MVNIACCLVNAIVNRCGAWLLRVYAVVRVVNVAPEVAAVGAVGMAPWLPLLDCFELDAPDWSASCTRCVFICALRLFTLLKTLGKKRQTEREERKCLILEPGSSGSRIRFQLQLVTYSTDTQIWHEHTD